MSCSCPLRKFVQTSLFSTAAKICKTIYRKPKNVYEHFINVFVNVHDDLMKEDAHHKAQEEWWSVKNYPTLLKSWMDSLEQSLARKGRQDFPKFRGVIHYQATGKETEHKEVC